MKKTIVVLFSLMLLTSFLSATPWVSFSSSTPSDAIVEVEQSDASGITLNVTIPGMYVKTVTENGEEFQHIELTEFRNTNEIGKPQLPMISELIGIPNNQNIKASIISSQKRTFTNYNVFPFQTPEKDIKNGKVDKFVIDNTFYNSAEIFPENQLVLDSPSIWRDVMISGLHFVPFSFDPSNRELIVTTEAKIRIEFVGINSELTLTKDKVLSPDFYNLYNSAVLNFQDLDYSISRTDDPGIKYLIITNTGAVDHIQSFVDWKNQQGFKVEVRTLEAGFNQPQHFKTYISQLYNSDGLEYVLMVGDAYPNGGNNGGPDDVPMYYWNPAGEDASYSDTWYVCLDGADDHYADLAIGRYTYDNYTELELQMQKTLDHYLAPDASSDWAENTILVAHEQDYPQKYTQCKEEIRNYNYAIQTPVSTTCYGGAGATNNDIIDFINDTSCGIFNYRGHGSATEFWEWGPSGSFTATHVNQLQNENKLFVLFDVCCDNMDIVAYNGNCLTESFMKHENAAVAVNGAIIPSYTIPNHDYDKEMYKAVFHEGIHNIGYVSNFANVTVLNVHGTIGRSNVRTYLWLGDSSLEPWTLQPSNLNVSHDGQLFLGLSSFDVTVMGNNGPIENGRVCVSNEQGTIYGVAFSDASGLAHIEFDSPIQDPGNVNVTVTSHNYLPSISVIPVIPQEGPYVVHSSHLVNDIAGNNNGVVDYGESIELTVAVENVGIQNATNVIVTLTTPDPYTNITDNTENYGLVPAGGTISINDAFAFDVDWDIPDGHYIQFILTATDGTDVWESTLSIPVQAPILEFESFLIDDSMGNNNGKFDVGETINIEATIGNVGHSNADEVETLLSTSSQYITIDNGSVTIGDLNGEDSATATFTVTSSQNTPNGHYANFNVEISALHDLLANGEFNIVVGQIPVAIIDLDGNSNSAPEMETAFEEIGIPVEVLTSIPTDPNLYSSIFLCLGIYSNNHVLSSAEGTIFADYLNNGGNLYMEGGDTWYYDSSTPVHAMFNINGTTDGSGDLGTINGVAGTITDGMTFTYSGDNSWIDHLEPIGNGEVILNNVSPAYGTAISNDGGTYKTIGASHEFGGISDASATTKAELMYKYMEFFGLVNNDNPQIAVNPEALNTVMFPNEVNNEILTISNTGTQILDFTIEIEDTETICAVKSENLTRNSIQKSKSYAIRTDWLNADIYSGSVDPGQSMEISIEFDTDNMNTGNYSTNINVASNDPFNSLVVVPVTLEVLSTPLAEITIGSANVNIGEDFTIPVSTTELVQGDGIIAYQFDLEFDETVVEYVDHNLNGTLSNGGMVSINTANPGIIMVGFMTVSPIIGEGTLIELNFTALADGETVLDGSNFLYNTDAMPVIDGLVTVGNTVMYGDVDANGTVQAFDASLALQMAVGLVTPTPVQFIVADVDGNEVIQAFDASLILQYAVGLISIFPVEEMRDDYSAPVAKVSVEVIDNELVFSTNGNLYGFEVSVDGYSIENAKTKMLVQQNENKVAVASAQPVSGEFLRIPFSIIADNEATLNMVINTQEEVVTITNAPAFNEFHGNFPNPFNPTTYFNLSLKEDCKVRIDIYNIKGAKVESINKTLVAGKHQIKWNAENKASGVYFYQVDLNGKIYNRKALLLK